MQPLERIRQRPWLLVACGLAAALALGATPWLFEFLNNPFLVGASAAKSFGDAKNGIFFLNFLILPVAAFILLFFPQIRWFRIGFLLGAGLAWLTMFSLCWHKYM